MPAVARSSSHAQPCSEPIPLLRNGGATGLYHPDDGAQRCVAQPTPTTTCAETRSGSTPTIRRGPRSTCPSGVVIPSSRPAMGRCSTAGLRADGPPDSRRRWLTLGGIFYQADVWLDGAYLGDPEGYFMPHTFDITALAHWRRARGCDRGRRALPNAAIAGGDRSPVCSSTGTASTARGIPAASGARCTCTTRGPCASTAPRAVPRRRRVAPPTCSCWRDSTATVREGSRC